MSSFSPADTFIKSVYSYEQIYAQHTFHSICFFCQVLFPCRKEADVKPVGVCTRITPTGNSDWQFIHPNQHVSFRTAEHDGTRDQDNPKPHVCNAVLVHSGEWLKTCIAALRPLRVWLPPWLSLQVHPRIGTDYVILCMSKQITVTRGSVGGAEYTVWGMMDWKTAIFWY